MTVSFKSVGELSTDRQFRVVPNELPIGIKTPLTLGQGSDGILAMHYKTADQIQDNFRNLLMTNWGERLGFYDFGANLRGMLFDLTAQDFDTQVMVRIKRAVSKWMPYIELSTFDKTILGRDPNSGLARIRIKITYNVPKLGITNKGIELSFSLGG